MEKFNKIIYENKILLQVHSAPRKNDADYYDDSTEIDLIALGSSEKPLKTTAKRDAPEESYSMRPRRQQASGRAQFYNLLMDILATLQNSTKNDIRQAKKRELQRG